MNVGYEKQFTVELDKLSGALWNSMNSSYHTLYKAACCSPTLDPKFNAIHWAHDVCLTLEEIKYSISWMRTYAKVYKDTNPRGSNPSDVSFHVSYYADNSITRLHSCRDKLALMIWAYYCPFNPLKRDEVLDYYKIQTKLATPVNHGLTLKHHEQFLVYLNNLDNPEFKRIAKYRHLKIHSMIGVIIYQ